MAGSRLFQDLYLSLMSFQMTLHDVFEIGSGRELICAVLFHEMSHKVELRFRSFNINHNS